MPDEPTETDDIAARLQQLQEQVEAEPVVAPAVAEPAPAPPAPRAPKQAAVPMATPVKKAPAKKAAAKKAPAKKAPVKKAAATKVPVPDLERPLTPWPVSQAPVSPAVPDPTPVVVPPPVVAAPPVVEPPPVVAPPSAVEPAAVTTVPARERDGLLRFLITLAVLLLAAAAGLGAAAFVEHRDTSFRAAVVVQLAPGPDPTGSVEDAVSQGVADYVSKASSHDFTVRAAQRATLSTSAVKGDVVAKPRGSKQVELDVLADTAADARLLATGAGDALVEFVNEDQVVNQDAAGDRLSAAVQGDPQGVRKAAPKDRDAWIAGALAAGAVLVLAGVATVLRLTRRT